MSATSIPWITKVQGPRYGTDDTYRLAAEWLKDCTQVADWGGGRGYFQRFLPETMDYQLIDGTHQGGDMFETDLATFTERCDGILLRHVLEMSHDWSAILTNALEAFTTRMVIVTFTPRVKVTHLAKYHLTWPVYHFNHTELMLAMQPYLVRYQDIRTTQPERVYYLEKSRGNQ